MQPMRHVEKVMLFNHAVNACTFLQCAIFTYIRITQLLPLVITSSLHNHKQDV